MSIEPVLKILLISDSRPGHVSQSLGLIKVIERIRPVEVTELVVSLRLKILRLLLRYAINKNSQWRSFLIEKSYGFEIKDSSGFHLIVSSGGDTSFANTAEAYNRLDPQIKDQVDSLYAIHDFSKTFGRNMSEEERKSKQEKYPPARHPVIRTHPETGERGIYTNQPFVSHIEGISEEESRRLLNCLQQAILDPSVQCRIKWAVNTIVMWDNRIVQHQASNDFYPQTRHVERVTIIGTKPV